MALFNAPPQVGVDGSVEDERENVDASIHRERGWTGHGDRQATTSRGSVMLSGRLPHALGQQTCPVSFRSARTRRLSRHFTEQAWMRVRVPSIITPTLA